MLAIVDNYIIWAKLQETGGAHCAVCIRSIMFILYLYKILLAPNAWSTDNETTLRTNALSLKCISTIRPKFDRMPDDLFIFYSITTLELE